MKVLMQARINLFSVPGGDTIQVQKTKAALESLGVQADLSLELQPRLENYDLVHIFNFTRIQETYVQAQNAFQHGKPILLSTIYWSFDEFEQRGQVGWRHSLNRYMDVNRIEYLKGLWRFVKDGERNLATMSLLRHGYRGLQHATLPVIDAFLPNSEIEMRVFCQDFGLDRTDLSYTVVPNGVDLAFGETPTIIADEVPEGSILCVARIETRKNQLSLLRAAKDLNVPLVFVGACAPNHRKYLEALRAEADDNVIFLGRVDHDRLPAIYRKAQVHALVSWFETPGLSSLEAGLSGCQVVVSDRGSTNEYFGDFAHFCDPGDIRSIRSALEAALVAPRSHALSNRIRANFTWEMAGERTLQAYRKVLACRQAP